MVAGVLWGKFPFIRLLAVDCQAVEAVGGSVHPGGLYPFLHSERDPHVLGWTELGVVSLFSSHGVVCNLHHGEILSSQARRGGLLNGLSPGGGKGNTHTARLKPCLSLGKTSLVVPHGEMYIVAGHGGGAPVGDTIFHAVLSGDPACISRK